MPKYYHVHRGTTPSNVGNKFIKNCPLFFSRKNSNWYNIEKDISKDYGGYWIYEIYIPSKRFTVSFNPSNNCKIVKITKNNINEYVKLKEEYIGHNRFIEEMKKRNIIGIDATIEHTDAYISGPPEGYIWQKPSDRKIKLFETVKF